MNENSNHSIIQNDENAEREIKKYYETFSKDERLFVSNFWTEYRIQEPFPPLQELQEFFQKIFLITDARILKKEKEALSNSNIDLVKRSFVVFYENNLEQFLNSVTTDELEIPMDIEEEITSSPEKGFENEWSNYDEELITDISEETSKEVTEIIFSGETTQDFQQWLGELTEEILEEIRSTIPVQKAAERSHIRGLKTMNIESRNNYVNKDAKVRVILEDFYTQKHSPKE